MQDAPELFNGVCPKISVIFYPHQEGSNLSEKGFADFVKADSERFIEYLNDIFQTFFPEEAEVWEYMSETVQNSLNEIPLTELEEGSWPIGDLLHLIQRSLSQAKEALGYDDSEKGIRKRFRYNRMKGEFCDRLRNFKAPRGLSSVRFSRRRASKPGNGITIQNLLKRLSDGQPALEQYTSL